MKIAKIKVDNKIFFCYNTIKNLGKWQYFFNYTEGENYEY